MNILFGADPLASFKIYKDSTFSMMREAQRRGYNAEQVIDMLFWCLLGGVIGILLGWAISYTVGRVAAATGNAFEPAITLSSILLATIFSAAIGMFFGIYPANRAASLQPVEALRSD